jgi:hypothetical protein
MPEQHQATHGISLPKNTVDIASVSMERNKVSMATSAMPHNGGQGSYQAATPTKGVRPHERES